MRERRTQDSKSAKIFRRKFDLRALSLLVITFLHRGIKIVPVPLQTVHTLVNNLKAL